MVNTQTERTATSREFIEQIIEHLIGVLDNFEVDPDFEPDLSWSESFNQDQITHDLRGLTDLEFDVATEPHDAGGEGEDWGSTVNTAFMDRTEQAVMS